MLELISAVQAAVQVFFRSRRDAAIEILALRQQLAVLKRKHPRPKLSPVDRLFWTVLRRIWSGWGEALIIVKPDTVVRWHRTGFRLYWRWRSPPGSGGRPKTTAEIRTLIRRMAEENLDWGAPKIHGELLRLGFNVSERTVARYLQRIRRRGDPSKSTAAALASRARERPAAMAMNKFVLESGPSRQGSARQPCAADH